MKKNLVFFSLVLALAAGVSCREPREDGPNEWPVVKPDTVKVTSVSLSRTVLDLVSGESFLLEASVLPEDATDRTVLWTSSDSSVASVSETGLVTAVSEGSAVITATAGDKSASCTVEVKDPAVVVEVESIELSASLLVLTEGECVTLSAALFPEEAGDSPVFWSSSDAEVASVDSCGNVVAKSEGTASIIASAGNVGDTCAVRVLRKKISVSSVELDPDSLSMTEGETAMLHASVLPEDADDRTVEWHSSNPDVATVQEGLVTAIKEGRSKIVAKSGEFSAECEVTVSKKFVAVASVALDKSELLLAEGESEHLAATVLPSDATDPSVIWSSSDPVVATVTDGVVTALKKGRATITATSGEKSASCVVTVYIPEILVSSVTLDKTEISLTEGFTDTLSVKVLPEDADYQTIFWSSSDSRVATVSDGVVVAVSKGKADITVSAGGKSAVCKVTVFERVEVSGLTLDRESVSMKPNEFVTLMATVAPEDATDKTVIWSSSNEGVAVVFDDGTVKAVFSGNATIFAKCGSFTASCEISVNGDTGGSGTENVGEDPGQGWS